MATATTNADRDPCLNSDGTPKYRFQRATDARRTAKQLEYRHRRQFEMYRCPSCKFRHIGRSSGRARRQRRDQRAREGILAYELGDRAFIHLLAGDRRTRYGATLTQRLAAAARKRGGP